MRTIQIALTGELDENVVAHRAIPRALFLAGAAVGCQVEARWVPTTDLLSDPTATLEPFHGHWCVPGSPYASTDGALAAITDSRLGGRPFLGTCGGFQHAVLEFARNVARIPEAVHEELGDAGVPVIHRLACSLVDRDGRVNFVAGTRIARAYGRFFAMEGYDCNYGVNPEFQAALERAGMHVSAIDDEGAARAVELPRHPFFVATLFQPERSALASARAHPLIAAFVEAARQRATGETADEQEEAALSL